jgi:hypothetical protein
MQNKDIDRPFENVIWVKAKKIAERYNIRMEENIALGYVANSQEMPTVWADGKTMSSCLAASITAHTVAVATMLEFGKDEPPIPMKDRPLGGQEGVRVIPSFLDDVLPPVKDEDVPPMPKCKPPKEEVLEEEMFALHDVLTSPKEIQITSIDQIIEQITNDGDLREHEFHEEDICCEGDDLGFYQQACVFLLKETAIDGDEEIQKRLTANAEDFDGIIMDILKKLATIQTCKKGHKFVANSHEYPCPWCIIDKTKSKLS